MSNCTHKKWHPGKMIDLVGSDSEEQIWQEGFIEKTIENVIGSHRRCTQCNQRFDAQGISATDIKRKTDGTRVTQAYIR
jgi:hypothetical protein